jgi:hypothetical protein
VRHYLIDFSGCLGAASIEPPAIELRHRYLVNFGSTTKSLVTLSLMPFKWEHAVDPDCRASGASNPRCSTPPEAVPAQPAFDQRTERDIRRGAHRRSVLRRAHQAASSRSSPDRARRSI